MNVAQITIDALYRVFSQVPSVTLANFFRHGDVYCHVDIFDGMFFGERMAMYVNAADIMEQVY